MPDQPAPPTPAPASPLGRLLSANQVAREIGVSRATVWRLVKAGGFPRKIKVGRQAVRWSECEVEAWKQARQNPG